MTLAARSYWTHLSGLLLVTLSLVCVSDCRPEKQRHCDHELRDEPQQGRVVKRLDFDCTSGNIDWHGPYGGLYIEVHGPAERHQLCLQTRSVHTSAFFYSVPDADSPTTKLLTLNETKGNEKAPTSTLCFEAQGSTVFLVVPDLGAPISSVIHISYDIDSPPNPGDDGSAIVLETRDLTVCVVGKWDQTGSCPPSGPRLKLSVRILAHMANPISKHTCRPCTDDELLYYYCTSDFVAIGSLLDVKPSAAANIIPVSLDLIKRQSVKHFTKDPIKTNKYTGLIYTPAQCKMHYGTEKFVFMGKMKFGKAKLRCAPTYEDFYDLQKASKLKGTLLCS